MIKAVAKFLTNPLLYVFLVLFVLVLWQRADRKKVTCAIILIYLLCSPVTYNIAIGGWSVPDTQSFESPYEAVVVLSGVTDIDWYINTQQQYPNINYFALNQNKERVFAGIQFLKSGQAQKLYFADLTVGEFSETEVVREFVLSQGVPSENFVVYGQIENTADEAKVFRDYFTPLKNQRILLVTSEIHMRRALATFEHFGIAPDTFSVNRRERRLNLNQFIPSAGGTFKLQTLFYEIFGYIGYLLQGEI